jgi:hypothetical protein
MFQKGENDEIKKKSKSNVGDIHASESYELLFRKHMKRYTKYIYLCIYLLLVSLDY